MLPDAGCADQLIVGDDRILDSSTVDDETHSGVVLHPIVIDQTVLAAPIAVDNSFLAASFRIMVVGQDPADQSIGVKRRGVAQGIEGEAVPVGPIFEVFCPGIERAGRIAASALTKRSEFVEGGWGPCYGIVGQGVRDLRAIYGDGLAIGSVKEVVSHDDVAKLRSKCAC